MDAIILFGSRARGDSTEYSDYDVLIFDENTDGSILDRLRFVRQFIPGGNIDLHLYSPKLSPLLAYQILKDARILYEASSGLGTLKLAELAIHAEKGDVPFKYIREIKKMGKDETLRKLERRISQLENRVYGLKRHLIPLTEEEFLTDEVMQEFAFARLYKISQDVIDIAAMILALEGKVPSPEATERLSRLGELGIIPEALSSNLVEIARFRNVLAHIYHALDLSRLYQFSRVDIKDIEDFIGCVQKYVIDLC